MDEWKQRNKENNNIEIKPEDINKAIEPKLTELKTGLSTDIDNKLSPILEYIKTQKDKEEATERQKQQQQSREDLEVKPEDYITDPEAAINKRLTPLERTIQAQSAIIMRDKVLGKMDYYSTDPTFAAKVDAMLDSQPLHLRSNSAVIMNAYKSVHYDMQNEIKEGKIKSFASQASLSNNGTGGHSGTEDKEDITKLSAEEKAYAKKMGLTEEQWVAGKRELEYV